MINQTVTIVNKSGKIVSTSKHLVNVFNEAKSAYNERKAEIKAARKNEQEDKEREWRAVRQLEALSLQDADGNARSSRSSRRGSEDGSAIRRKPVPRRAGKQERPALGRGVSDSFYANEAQGRHTLHETNQSPASKDISGLAYGTNFVDDEPRSGELTRRHTDGMQLRGQHGETRPHRPRRTSEDSIDMDLAYGDLPPTFPQTKHSDEVELRSKMSSLQRLLDEGNCVQHSVTAMIDNLQKNPDALAAVALTLAEISNMAAKMAPGALAAMKTSFPAIVALLASPQFAIAVGVGVGVTIIALGSYKIVKKIKARNEEKPLLLEQGGGGSVVQEENSGIEGMDELREISRIERWRRGIADEQVTSLGTSVEGEFITPVATKTMIEDGRLTEADLKPVPARSAVRKAGKSKKAKSEVSTGSIRSKRSKKKDKEASTMLRGLFKGQSASRRTEREKV